MKTIGEHISLLRSSYRAYSVDLSMTNRFLYRQLQAVALQLIKQETNKRKLWDTDTIFSPQICLNMTIRSASECGIHYGEYFAVSEPIDQIAESQFGYIARIYNASGMEKIDLMGVDAALNIFKLKTKRPKPRAFLRDNRIFVTQELEKILLQAAFLDPLRTCPRNDCFSPMDQPFRFPDYLLGSLYDLTRERIDNFYRRSREDGKTDANDTSQ